VETSLDGRGYHLTRISIHYRDRNELLQKHPQLLQGKSTCKVHGGRSVSNDRRELMRRGKLLSQREYLF